MAQPDCLVYSTRIGKKNDNSSRMIPGIKEGTPQQTHMRLRWIDAHPTTNCKKTEFCELVPPTQNGHSRLLVPQRQQLHSINQRKSRQRTTSLLVMLSNIPWSRRVNTLPPSSIKLALELVAKGTYRLASGEGYTDSTYKHRHLARRG